MAFISVHGRIPTIIEGYHGPVWCSYPIVRGRAAPPADQEQNPYAKFVPREDTIATLPEWWEKGCTFYANPSEVSFLIFGPPAAMLVIGASLMWVIRGFRV